MYAKESLDEIVYRQFIEGFYSCFYQAGQKIDPAELANEYQMSRTPVVQALKRLANEKILDVQANGRFIIPVPTETKLRNICETRLLFEQEAIRQLIERHDQNVVSSLSDMAKRCHLDYSTERAAESVKQDLNFHRALVSSTGNACMQELYGIILNRFIGIKYILNGQYSSQNRAVGRHIELMRYIEGKNEPQAMACIEFHIMHSMNQLTECIRSQLVESGILKI